MKYHTKQPTPGKERKCQLEETGVKDGQRWRVNCRLSQGHVLGYYETNVFERCHFRKKL